MGQQRAALSSSAACGRCASTAVAGRKDIGFDQQRDFDSGGDAPAFLGFKAEGLEGVRQRLAQAQAVEEIERGATVWVVGA